MTQRILLAEDNEDNRTIYRTILEHSGYTVVEAQDGEAAVRLAAEERPDLILLDISMPLLDGWEAARQIRDNPDTAGIPIVALTAHALQQDRARAIAEGFDSYLAKPVEPRRVVEEVRRLLDGEREQGTGNRE
ncbi:MAG: response regulator [Longimicrobiaceae bacterium]